MVDPDLLCAADATVEGKQEKKGRQAPHHGERWPTSPKGPPGPHPLLDKRVAGLRGKDWGSRDLHAGSQVRGWGRPNQLLLHKQSGISLEEGQSTPKEWEIHA